jgi:hypothetical protein
MFWLGLAQKPLALAWLWVAMHITTLDYHLFLFSYYYTTPMTDEIELSMISISVPNIETPTQHESSTEEHTGTSER